VLFDGKDVTNLSPQDRNIAMVFQFPVIYDMNVFDNLMFPLLSKGVSKKEARKEVSRIAEVLSLTYALKYRSKDLDMGARQRVTLGRALVRKPSAFLMDEPLSSIEPEGKWHLKMQIREIQETLEQTLIYVTHDQSEALTLADKIAVMSKGELLQYDSRDAIYENPANTFVGYFIGDPGMNFIDCSLKDDCLMWDDFKHDVPAASLGKQGAEYVIGIRPEHILASKTEKKNWVAAKLTAVENLGNMQILHILAGKHAIKAKLETWEAPSGGAAGGAVWIDFPKDKIKIFKKTGELIGT
jgi:glycerol transport system ATP-binding protein